MKLFDIVHEKEARRALAHVERDLGRLRNPAEHIAERVRERDMLLAWATENGWMATPDREGNYG